MEDAVCNTCKHLTRGAKNFTCPAYPAGIPMMLLSGEITHEKPIAGQTGKTVWEKRQPRKPKTEARVGGGGEEE